VVSDCGLVLKVDWSLCSLIPPDSFLDQCNVSLVGQWIDEAKSKLKDPGLVYSYHGHSRKRDPLVLAMNSIVVTTYETLASDATYHRTKSQEHDYCPPCEQVRWWRIICDESHVLRYANNSKSEAVMNLVADNKWLVSGMVLLSMLWVVNSDLSPDDTAKFCRNARQHHTGRPGKPVSFPWNR
jgi:SNF2 family DNA or RNA helicase